MAPPSFTKFLLEPDRPHSRRDRLSGHELEEDRELLLAALQSAYPAQWVMPPADWRAFLGEIRALPVRDEMEAEAFGTALADLLWAVPDGHLKVKLGNSLLGTRIRGHERSATTGSNIAGQSVWRIESRKGLARMVPVVGISRFPQSSEPAWNGFLDEIGRLRNAQALIVDLRGNGGGDDTKAIEMISILAGSEITLDWVREIVCESAEAYALQINTYSRIIWSRYEALGLEPPAELLRHRDSFREKAGELAASPHPDPRIIRQVPLAEASKSPAAFEGKVFVLVDPLTGSSGEWAALYLQRHLGARLVGENTYGMIHFGNSGLLRLPKSGLEITLCMKINELTDGRFFEKTGILPDLPVSGADSLKEAVRWVSEDPRSEALH